MNLIENFIKGPLTSLLGLVIMCVACYGWYMDSLNDWQSIIALTVGFSLLFMKDKLPEYVGSFFKGVIGKFLPNKDK